MIALGQIRLRQEASVYDARRKIRGLGEALGYDRIVATRLATAASQASRELLREGREPRIEVGLSLDVSPPQLVLDFQSRGPLPGLAGLEGLDQLEAFGISAAPQVTDALLERLAKIKTLTWISLDRCTGLT